MTAMELEQIVLQARQQGDVAGLMAHIPYARLIGMDNGDLCCLDTGGNVIWASGKDARFFKGYGPIMIADGMIIAMEPGSTSRPKSLLRLVEATPEGYRQLAEAKVLDGHDAWAPMALAGGRLIVRDFNTMRCLDLRAAPSAGTE